MRHPLPVVVVAQSMANIAATPPAVVVETLAVDEAVEMSIVNAPRLVDVEEARAQ